MREGNNITQCKRGSNNNKKIQRTKYIWRNRTQARMDKNKNKQYANQSIQGRNKPRLAKKADERHAKTRIHTSTWNIVPIWKRGVGVSVTRAQNMRGNIDRDNIRETKKFCLHMPAAELSPLRSKRHGDDNGQRARLFLG